MITNCVIETCDYYEFMEMLGDKSVDLILTDPPYGISRETNFSQMKNYIKKFDISMEFGEWDKIEIDLDAMCDVFYKSLCNSGTAVIWYDIWKMHNLKESMEKAGFKMLRQIIWQKKNPVPLNQFATYLSNSREMAIVGVRKGTPTFNSSYDNGIYEHGIPKRISIHPTQKPLSLFEELVIKHSNVNDFVVDPFVGSGTTAIACKKTFRNFAGCDINKEYVEISNDRINNL